MRIVRNALIADRNLQAFVERKQKEGGSAPVSDVSFLKPLVQLKVILFEVETTMTEHDLKVINNVVTKIKDVYTSLKKSVDISTKQIHAYVSKKQKEKENSAQKVLKDEEYL